ncbi:glycosyltransferase family 4 protein [Winogradskyella echinorum]|uniref:Glycosyltransferase family 4 protein n=1 Tax=Winogradskyella echinorum TaxID=538189 RepID=A0ABR6Y3V7_9FLAO|nr:glycosyltransferase family 4 protein [Winogradskyella echinorum]MBC3846935.1 glycosyltransferase family 4 protein [Winogradskyella echinorum]MBC5751283.1 glycosyltransferase family 4 protein [Winogradskyella echinorum]
MKNLLYIGNALSNKGKATTVIDTLSRHLKKNYKVKIASTKSNKIWRLLDMMKLVVANKSNTDYVLIDTYSTSNFYFALIISQLCRLFKLNYINILHGGNLEKRLKKNPKLSGLIFKNAYKLVAPSNFLKSTYETYGYNEVLHIPNSIEIEDYKFKEREISDIKLFWVRSFSSLYNPEQAILVLEKLLQLNYNASLTMVGPDVDGSLLKVKELAKDKKLNVNFTGKLSILEWIELSEDFNVFINTTNFDNTPVSVIEAMALGLPVVSTNVGGMPFLITHNTDGLLVPPKDVSSMVNAIIKLKLDNELRIKLIRNARTKVENFSWNKVKSKWEFVLS